MQKNLKDKRSRFTKEEKSALVARWLQSGQPAGAFAAEAGVGMSTLFKWRLGLGGTTKLEARQKRRSNRTFVPVRVRRAPDDGAVRISGPHGMTIEVDGRTNEAALKMAVRAIAACG